jgi:hypothetical protein
MDCIWSATSRISDRSAILRSPSHHWVLMRTRPAFSPRNKNFIRLSMNRRKEDKFSRALCMTGHRMSEAFYHIECSWGTDEEADPLKQDRGTALRLQGRWCWTEYIISFWGTAGKRHDRAFPEWTLQGVARTMNAHGTIWSRGRPVKQ